MLFFNSMVLTRPYKNKIRTLINFNKSHNNVGPHCERENSNWYTKIINCITQMVYNTRLFLNYTEVRVIQLHSLLRITLIENLEVQSRLIAGVSLSSNRASALSVVVTELKLLNTGARAIVSASLAS